MLSTVSAVFAKSSVVWSTSLYILTNKSIKSKIFVCNKENESNSKQIFTAQYFSRRETLNNRKEKIIFIKNSN